MSIIQRYLLREVSLAFGAVMFVLLLVYMSNRFVRFLAQAAAGDISADIVLRLVMYKTLVGLVLLLPLSLFVAILLALGRLHRDSEIVALTAGGVGLGRITLTLATASFGLAVVTAILSFHISPRVATLQAELIERSRGDVQLSGIYPGRFQSFSGGEQVVYAERLEPGRQALSRVFAHVLQPETEYVFVAERAYLTFDVDGGNRYIVMENGHRHSGVPGRRDYVVTQFVRHAVLLGESSDEAGYRRLETYATSQLLDAGGAAHLAEYHWRLSMPIALIVLAVMAVPLSYTSPRQGRYARLFAGVLIYFLYSNAIGVAQKLLEREQMPMWLGIWPVHLLALAATAALMLRQPGVRWRALSTFKRLRRR